MNQKYFVEITKKIVAEQAVQDIIENLKCPPGKNPSKESSELSLFYNELTDEEKQKLREIIEQAAETTLFGMLCVLDGVRAIESGEDKGSLELWFRKDNSTMLLNDPDEDFLHDLIF